MAVLRLLERFPLLRGRFVFVQLTATLSMSQQEQRDRMRALLAEFNVCRWAGRMLVDASRIRGKDRLSARLSDQSVAL